MSKIAFMFPGQGSFEAGMGRDIALAVPEAMAIYDEGNEVSGMDLKELCFNRPVEDLVDTQVQQPALVTTCLAMDAALRARGITPDVVVGHSVGEFAALAAAEAMTIEEAFFRGWLQKRIGVIASTALFALAHSGLGQPFLLIGVSVISLVIGFTFYRTRNLIPGIIAHGIFDAVQLFVIIPVVFKMSGMGAP